MEEIINPQMLKKKKRKQNKEKHTKAYHKLLKPSIEEKNLKNHKEKDTLITRRTGIRMSAKLWKPEDSTMVSFKYERKQKLT